MSPNPASSSLEALDALWRAANYLSVGQIYLFDNPLLKLPLERTHIERVPRLEPRAADLIQTMREKLIQHRQYVNTYGDDMPEIKNWKWSGT